MSSSPRLPPPRRWFGAFLAFALMIGACSDADPTAETQSTLDTANATIGDAPAESTGADEGEQSNEGVDNTLGSRDDGDVDQGAEEPNPTVSDPPADPQAPRVVAFEPGASAIVMSDSVVRGNRHTYTVAAGKGQTMELLITSVENNAVFDLLDPSGNVIEQEVTNTTTVLPADGVYRVVVSGTRGNASYELTIVIPPGTTDAEESAEPTAGPEAIRFESGASSATVTGRVQDAQIKMYTIDVSAGQTMTFALTASQSNGAVTVVTPSGQILISDATVEEFVLDEDGEYALLISATQGQAVYQLTVTVI